MADEKLRYIIEVDTKTGISEIRNFKNEIVATADSAKQLATEVKNLHKGTDGKGGMQGLTTATGGASAAALELGRVISDSPYGIRGMANNVSQLASSILFMSQQTDKATGVTVGFVNAVKGVGRALMGPLGVLLLIQTAIALLEHFAGSTKKAEKEVEELNKALAEVQATTDVNTAKLMAYVEAYKESEKGTKQQMNALKELRKYGIDPAVEGWENLVEAQLKLIGLQAMEGHIKKMLSEAVVAYEMSTDKMLSLTNDLNDELQKLSEAGYDPSMATAEEAQMRLISTREGAAVAAASSLDVFNKYFSIERELEGVIKDRIPLMEKRNGLEERFKGILKDMLSLMGIKKKQDDDNNKAMSEYQQKLLDLSSELQKYRQIELKNMDVSEEERLRLEYEASRRAVENKRQEFKDKEDARLDARLKEIQDLKATEEEKEALIRDAYETYNDAQIKANQDMRSVMLQMDVAYYSELGALRREDTEEAKKQAEDLAISLGEGALEFIDFVNEKNIQKQTNDLDRIEAERDANKALTEQKIANLQRELEVEGLTAAQIQDINNEISRAKNDQTLYEQQLDLRAAQTKIAIANQVANAVKAIAGEGSGIAKGVAVAQTIWNTKQAFMAALGSAPYGPWNIAQAAAVAAMGAMQVKQILATKAPYEKSSGAASSAAGGGAGGGTTFNPNFNIVGSSGANQLASTVAGQLGEPTRAYVVYGDITTAEELESNAVQSAGL